MLLTALLLTACKTNKNVVQDKNTTTSQIKNTSTTKEESKKDAMKAQITYLQKVYDNMLYQKNIVSKISFTIQSGSKDITVPGSIHMRKDDVIRLQLFLPLIGTEVGRLEFTKDYVMIVDRIHKQYIKENYNKVDFLCDKGLNFYSLQALFWNQLFLPGYENVDNSQLDLLSVDFKSQNNTISTKKDAMSFQWSADKNKGLINKAYITYSSAAHGSSNLEWIYDDFRSFGSKQYPHSQALNFQTTATKEKKEVKVTIEMNGVSDEKDWENRTTVSNKYKSVSAEDALKQLMNF